MHVGLAAVFQNPGDAATFESLPPQQHCGHRCGKFPRQDPVGQSLRRTAALLRSFLLLAA